MIKSLSRTHKGLTIAILSLIAALNYRYTSNTITLVDDESYYDDPDHNNNNHNNDYGNINVNRANLNFLTRTNHQDLLVDLVNRPMNPHDDNSLTRRLAHNTRGLEHLDPNSAKYKRILKRRQGFRIARKEERVRRRVQLRTLKRMMTDVHLRRGERTLDQIPDTPFEDEEIQDQDLTPQTICSRPTDLGTARDFNLLQQYSKRAKCPGTGPESDTKSILLIEGTKTFGRTGNNLIEFLHALQYSRDHDVPLGVMSGSWAMRVLLKMWMAIQENNEEQWIDRFERAFCVKILKDEEELEFFGYENVIRMETRDLFVYKTQTSLNDYLGFQGDNLRTLWNEYNTGEGTDGVGKDVNDMCSGIDAVFGNDRETAIYSVIHSRSLEGEPGFKLLRNVSRKSGCDPVGALEMTPDYIKSILSPLGMLNYPIVFITDGQNSEVLERLQNDPDIGPQLRLVPEEASWVGGDITLAIMSNVFIGNPASTFSGFIAKSRLAMGFGHNYLFRAKNDQGGWMTICGDDCIFDRSIMASMY